MSIGPAFVTHERLRGAVIAIPANGITDTTRTGSKGQAGRSYVPVGVNSVIAGGRLGLAALVQVVLCGRGPVCVCG
jgi:hypothetical protein